MTYVQGYAIRPKSNFSKSLQLSSTKQVEMCNTYFYFLGKKKSIHKFPEVETFVGRNRIEFFFFIRRQDQQATKKNEHNDANFLNRDT